MLKRFLTYYKGQLHLFVIDIVAAVTVAAVDLAFPQILRGLAGGLFTEGPDAILGVLAYIAVGLVAMYALRFVCRYFVIYWDSEIARRMESRMREDLFDAYVRQSFAFFDRNRSGDLMSRLVSDLFDISEAAHHGPELLLIGVVEIAGSFVILSTINAPLTAVLALIACLLVAYNVWANVRMRAVYTENRVAHLRRQLPSGGRARRHACGQRLCRGGRGGREVPREQRRLPRLQDPDVSRHGPLPGRHCRHDGRAEHRCGGSWRLADSARSDGGGRPRHLRPLHLALHGADHADPGLHRDLPEGYRGLPTLLRGAGRAAGDPGPPRRKTAARE